MIVWLHGFNLYLIYLLFIVLLKIRLFYFIPEEGISLNSWLTIDVIDKGNKEMVLGYGNKVALIVSYCFNARYNVK